MNLEDAHAWAKDAFWKAAVAAATGLLMMALVAILPDDTESRENIRTWQAETVTRTLDGNEIEDFIRTIPRECDIEIELFSRVEKAIVAYSCPGGW